MIRVTIRNIGTVDVKQHGGIELPPPFHMLEISAGREIESVCTMEQMDSQWPHRSGFKVSDLLQQLVQRDVIRVDIEPYEKESVEDPQLVEVQKKFTKKSTPDEKREPVATQDEKDEPMSNDDLPDFTDPLYNAPPTKKKTKKVVEEPPEEAPGPTSEVGMGIDLPGAEIEQYQGKKKESKKDKFEGAVQMAFVGAGQGGGRIAQSFFDMGYSRVCAVNTTEQDLKSLTIENKLVIGRGKRGGAGKDPEQGRLAAKES